MNIAKNKNRKLKISDITSGKKRESRINLIETKFWARLQLNKLKPWFYTKMARIWVKNFVRDSLLSSLKPQKRSFWKFLEFEFCSAISFLSNLTLLIFVWAILLRRDARFVIGWNTEMRILELIFEETRFAEAVKRGQGLSFERPDWLTGSAGENVKFYLFRCKTSIYRIFRIAVASLYRF